MEPAELRAEFPVLAHVSYLNAGTAGPVPARARGASAERARLELERGRSGRRYHEAVARLAATIRAGLAELLGCSPGEVALTGSTTDGVNTVLAALDLAEGDEVVTSDEEHPGLLAPLAAAARRRGVRVRVAPFGDVGEAAREATRLIACSHVSWVTGRMVDAEAIAASPVPVLLDGAQGLGAVPVDVRRLGCDFYAASGQKWLCGPSGTGCLYVRAERAAELIPDRTGYQSLADPDDPLALVLHRDARRFDSGFPEGPAAAGWLAALELLGEAGWPAVHARAATLARRLEGALGERGIEVTQRGDSTLVSWRDGDAAATVERLASEGIVVRDIPGRGLVRASVGAWSSEEELDRLVALARD